MMISKLAMPVLAVAVAALTAACAPQPAVMAVSPPPASLSGPASATAGTAPTRGMPQMDHSNMGGMNMNDMMAHCAQMKQHKGSGTAMSADMRQMMARCDQMDRDMGMRGRSGR